MHVARTVAEYRALRAPQPGPVGLVPTMGFLQEGRCLTHEVKPELSVWLKAIGDRCGEERLMEISDLRFVYRLGV